MRHHIVLAILALSLVAPADAQETSGRDEAFARGKAVLAALKEADTTLFGTTFFGFYLHETQNIGTMRFDVSAAPEESGAVYRVAMDLKMAVGTQKVTGKFEALLDAGFGLVSRSSVEITEVPEGRITKKERNRREGGEWVYEAEIEGPAPTYRIATAEPDHWEMASLMLLVRRIDSATPQTFVFRGIHWPKPEEIDEPPPAVKDIVLTVEAPVKGSHRGGALEARRVRVEKTDDETTVFTLDEKGHILSARPGNVPLLIVAGTEEECARDLPGATDSAGPRGATTPKDAAMVYLRVLAKDLPVSALDDVFDYDALYEGLKTENEAIGNLTPEQFAETLRTQFESQEAAFTKEQLAAVEPALGVEETGETAKVTIPGAEESPFLLRRTPSGWKITRFPH